MMPLVHCTYACVISGKKKNTCWLNKNNFKSKYARGVNNYRFDCLSLSLSHSYIHIYNVCDVECKVSVFINKEEKREKRKRGRLFGMSKKEKLGTRKKILLKRVQTDHYSSGSQGQKRDTNSSNR